MRESNSFKKTDKATTGDVVTTILQIAGAVIGVIFCASGNVVAGVPLITASLAGGAKGNLLTQILKAVKDVASKPKGQMLVTIFWVIIMAGGCSAIQTAVRTEMAKVENCDPAEVRQVTTCQDGSRIGVYCKFVEGKPTDCGPIWPGLSGQPGEVADAPENP